MSTASLDLTYPFARLPFAASAVIIGVLSALYLACQWALPKPLPGIPYNQDAVKTILGDATELQQIKKEGGRPRAWFNLQPVKHNSPLVQAFLAPLSKPVLILSDFRESQDILLRRGKEFDRGPRHVANFSGIVPWHHIAMATADPQFKANRELVKDLMTPHFLNTVSGPEIYNNAMNFIELWKLKAQVAGGRPFRAEDDLHGMTFDIIKVVALGEGDNQSMTALYTDLVRSTAANAQDTSSAGQDEPFIFPENKPNVDLRAHGTQQEAVGAAATQPFPGLFHKINNRKPAMKEAYAAKFSMLDRQVSLGVERMKAGAEVKSALDYMMQRELASAKKAGRAPVFNSPSMYDELYGYIGAGHETSSTSLQWGLKHLAADQRVQTTLRESLRAAYADAVSEGRQPTFTEIIKTQVPYLDAVVEEILRVTGPVQTLFRTATVDTTILGHHVPKGTQVFLPITGPGFTAPAFAIEESVRSPSSQSHKHMRGTWDEADAANFVPERWLKAEDGTQSFDSQAGPMLAFSLGIRGCFGRRLAYLQLRILMTLIVWNFEFGTLPEELNSFEAVDTLTTKPVKCFVRLAVVQ
ncbi:cytochrome P450 [Apiospora saccharicola]|uniref:Cytochrome P450 n=1 Tax=Apiospora saccharicola TaxID=335842 RepID=A0ABR1UMN1_9PEZI